MRTAYHTVKAWVERYEKHLSSGALILGFVVDSLTLKRIDLVFENAVFLAYLVLAGGGMLLLNFYMGGKIRSKFLERPILFVPFVIQYALGGLWSGFFIFYSKSGAVATSWPFLLILVAVLIGNELLREHYVRLAVQISVFFFALYSFSIFFVPIIVNEMGPWIFVASGLASLALIALFIAALTKAVPLQMRQSQKLVIGSVGGIFALVNLLYFTNILPPIPLSLKDAGVYHGISSVSGGYEALEESGGGCFFCFRDTIHLVPGSPVYAYTSIFAPTAIETDIVHHWEYYDERAGEWVTSSKIGFPITGGRGGGYRGYTYKSNTAPGLWRVSAETPRGQVIGRMTFRIANAAAMPELETEVLR